MESIQSGLRAIFEDEERGVTTPDAVVGAIAARIRRGRAGRIAGVSAGTLTLAGFAAAVPFALSHLGSPDLAPGATPAVTATYFMPENPLGLGCGDPSRHLARLAANRSEVNVYDRDHRGQVNWTLPAWRRPYQPVLSASDARAHAVRACYEYASGPCIALDGVVAGGPATTPVCPAPPLACGTTIEFSTWPCRCRAERSPRVASWIGAYIEYMIGDANAAL